MVLKLSVAYDTLIGSVGDMGRWGPERSEGSTQGLMLVRGLSFHLRRQFSFPGKSSINNYYMQSWRQLV